MNSSDIDTDDDSDDLAELETGDDNDNKLVGLCRIVIAVIKGYMLDVTRYLPYL